MNSFATATQGRLINKTTDAFWDWEIRGRELTTTSGKLGTNGRKSTKSHPSPAKAQTDLQSMHYKKMREGFCLLAEDNPGPVHMQAFLTASYTGFAAFDFDPSKNMIAACRHTGNGGKSCEIILIDADSGEMTRTLGLKESDLSKLRFYGDSLIVQADDRVMRIEIESGQVTTLHEGGVFPHLDFDLQQDLLMFSKTSKKDAMISVLNLKTGKTLLEVTANEDHDVALHEVLYACALSPKGTAAAICQKAGEIELYNLKDGKKQLITGDFPYAAKLQFDRTGKWLGMIEQYGKWAFRLWELAGKNKKPQELSTAEFSTGHCFDFAFDPTGDFLAVREMQWVNMYDLKTKKPITRIEQRHVVKATGSGGFHLAYAADGRLLTRTDRGLLSLIEPHRH